MIITWEMGEPMIRWCVWPEMCSERDSPLKRLYRRTHSPGRLRAACLSRWLRALASSCSHSAACVTGRDIRDNTSGGHGGPAAQSEFRLAGSRQDKRLDRAFLSLHISGFDQDWFYTSIISLNNSMIELNRVSSKKVIICHTDDLSEMNRMWFEALHLRAHLYLHCLSICDRDPDRMVFTLHPRLGSDVIRGYGHFWPNLVATTWTLQQAALSMHVSSEEIATCNDKLGHGRLRQKSQTWISVNTKHQFTCFDCVPAWPQMLGPRSRM